MTFLRNSLTHFRTDTSGTVKIEFVIIAPLLFAWILGAFVFFDAYKHYSRSAKASYAIADIMSRQLDMDMARLLNMHDLMDALIPWSDSNKWIRISSISYDATDGYEVLWSHASGTNEVLTTDTLTDVALARFPDIAAGDTIIYTETSVPYRPLLKSFGLSGLTWRNRIAVRPRYVMSIASLD